ncbi:hypothetical protein EVJ58_g9445 [Rhodofomes roseus]|uniref:DUF4218 domain-containing protein n=1 Tax=Rhodofomes roseus TaxID=34475 RepID=A0A4Y9XTI3_9APHY|nr:hypothetical protein EVJ58_g9445 [Rhodofomes roseus]
MVNGKKKKVCLCSICKEQTYDDHGTLKPGVEQDLRTFKKHLRSDVLCQAEREHQEAHRAGRDEGDAREVDETNAVLLASFSGDSGQHQSLPVRPRDYADVDPTPGSALRVSVNPDDIAMDVDPPDWSHPKANGSNGGELPSSVDAMAVDRADPARLQSEPATYEELDAPMDIESSNGRLDQLAQSLIGSNVSAQLPDVIDDLGDDVRRRFSHLSLVESSLAIESRLIKDPKLTFTSAPTSLTERPPGLLSSSDDCRRFIKFRDWLNAQQRVLIALSPLGHRDADSRRAKLIQDISERLEWMSTMEKSAWETEKILAGLYRLPDQEQVCAPRVYDTAAWYAAKRALPPFLLAALLMVSALHTLSGVSRDAANLILATFRVLLYGAFVACSAGTSRDQLAPDKQALLDCIPRDIRSVVTHLKIEPVLTRYASCPSCSCIYAPSRTDIDNPYPLHCTFVDADGPPCGRPLVKKERHTSSNGQQHVRYSPLRPFPYHSVFSWIAALFSRRILEQAVESAWQRPLPADGKWSDILHAPALQSFRGPDNQPFSKQSNNDVHLVFGLYLDWFNPGGNKKAGKSRSLGAIYLVCINLPPHLRFRPENICLVGIIPGPNEPSLHQLNHFLRPLVDEMLVLWNAGLRLNQTALHVSGRLVRAAIIPLICDLPALRKAAGFAGHSSKHFCSFCLLKRSDINDISRPWPTRTWKEHLDIAQRWRDAATRSDRDALFEEHGLRWSELLRLPYWDPTRYAVVDAMHNLFLGELRHHCMAVWGIDVKDQKDKSVKKVVPHTPDEQKKHLDRLVDALRKDAALSVVTQPRKGYLVALAQLNNISPVNLSKREYAKALLQWCRVNGVDRLVVPPVLKTDTADFHLANGPHDISKFRVLTAEVINHIRDDINHGKLKADHWRTVCTINMVITLTRLWGSVNASAAEHHLLANFTHLVIAVDLASRRSMDASRARLFDFHMLEYLRTLRTLFEHDFVPNHHLSLHLSSCLLLFGPVHGWWAYPFERFNGIIQRLNTSNQIDKIPLTYMRVFHAAAGLRWQIASADWPDDGYIREVLHAFENVYQDAARGTRVVDVLGAIPSFGASVSYTVVYSKLADSKLDRSVYDAVVNIISHVGQMTDFISFYSAPRDARIRLSPIARFTPKLEVSGVTYGTHTGNIRNSFVCFRDATSGDPSLLRAGQISAIFLHSRTEKDASRVIQPFFIINHTELWYNRFLPQSTIIRSSDILAHFASFVYVPEGIGETCVVVRCLDRS